MTHLPFRSWCPVCIAARGVDDGHPAREITEDCKEVHLDYCFLRNKKGEEYAAVLALKDRLLKLLCGHVVPNKGASTEWVISQAIRDLQKMGHSNSVTLRSDGTCIGGFAEQDCGKEARYDIGGTFGAGFTGERIH